MENYSIFLPSYSIGNDNVYDKISEICSPYGKNAVVIGGHKAIKAVMTKLLESVKDTQIDISDFVWYMGESCYENVEILMSTKSVINADMIFAVGGGKALDTGKALAAKMNKPIFTFPTIASNCACTTSVSIMYTKQGVFKEPFFFKKPPIHAFINTEVMVNAPSQYLWAGMGDTYAKYFESSVSSYGEDLVHYHQLGVTVSQMCLYPILKYGNEAFEDNKNKCNSYSFEQTVLAISVSTGIASILLTSEHIIDYNTGLAHAVFYALTSYPHIEKNHLHGEVVAFGVLLLLLVDGQKDMFDKVYAFNKSVGLPTKLSQIELKEEQRGGIIENVLKMHDIDHNPYVVTAEMLNKAFDELCSYNS